MFHLFKCPVFKSPLYYESMFSLHFIFPIYLSLIFRKIQIWYTKKENIRFVLNQYNCAKLYIFWLQVFAVSKCCGGSKCQNFAHADWCGFPQGLVQFGICRNYKKFRTYLHQTEKTILQNIKIRRITQPRLAIQKNSPLCQLFVYEPSSIYRQSPVKTPDINARCKSFIPQWV